MPLYLCEDDVSELLAPADAVEAVEGCFARIARGAVEGRHASGSGWRRGS